jgi:hypothetical protein
MNFSLLFIGILIGLLIQKYIFPIIDLWLSVYEYKQSEIITIYQLNAQEQVALFNREYPELDENQNKELTPAIGFAYNHQDDDMYYEDCKKTIK